MRDAHAVYTDAWYSMGQEAETVSPAPRRSPRGVSTQPSWPPPRPDAVFLHCLPAHRGDEVTDDVLDGPTSRVWAQAANRMHTARGLLAWLVGPAQDAPRATAGHRR